MERRLGRGLGSLLGESAEDKPHSGGQIEIELGRIRPNPYQPRKVFDPSGLEELAHSIRAHGVLQAIVVRPADDHYEIVSGERRWRASQTAGRRTIPAVVRADLS